MKKFTKSISLVAIILAVVAMVQTGCQRTNLIEPENMLTPDPERKLARSWGNEVPVAWVDYQLKLVRTTPGFTPPNAARAFAYTGVALYESIKQATPNYNTLVGQLNELTALPHPIPT